MANIITQDETIQRLDDGTILVLFTKHISRVARVDEDAEHSWATHPGRAKDKHGGV